MKKHRATPRNLRAWRALLLRLGARPNSARRDLEFNRLVLEALDRWRPPKKWLANSVPPPLTRRNQPDPWRVKAEELEEEDRHAVEVFLEATGRDSAHLKRMRAIRRYTGNRLLSKRLRAQSGYWHNYYEGARAHAS